MSEYTLAMSAAERERYRYMAEAARRDEIDVWERAGVVPGAVVADVGCGPGAVTVVMAELVAPDGRVIGIERDRDALAAARAAVAAAGTGNVELREGEAAATGIEPGSVDVAVLRHVLAHNGGREQAIVDHLATLARPGGSVYVVDVDLTAIRMLGGDPDLDDLADAYVAFHRRRGNDPQVGLRLAQFAAAAGLVDIEHRGWYAIVTAPPGMRSPAWAARDAMVADGVIDAQDVTRWRTAFERMDAAAARPTLFAPLFSVLGRRPPA